MGTSSRLPPSLPTLKGNTSARRGHGWLPTELGSILLFAMLPTHRQVILISQFSGRLIGTMDIHGQRGCGVRGILLFPSERNTDNISRIVGREGRREFVGGLQLRLCNEAVGKRKRRRSDGSTGELDAGNNEAEHEQLHAALHRQYEPPRELCWKQGVRHLVRE